MTGCSNFFTKEVKPKGQMSFGYFDTVSYVYSYANDSDKDFEENYTLVFNTLKEYHQLFDIYHEYANIVNLCTINKNAGKEALVVSDELIEFLEYAKELNDLTKGKMDIMLGSVLHLWHDAREYASNNPSDAKIPTMEELEEANQYTGFEFLKIDKEKKTVKITNEKARIDVGALGKGYAVEKAANALEEKEVSSYVLNIGGNIRIIGTKLDGSKWVTGIKDPLNSDSNYSMYLEIADTSCVTSGVYERYFTVNNERYHHIIDKDTLMPANYYLSLTVITKNSGLADALSTALFCVEFEECKKIVEEMKDVEAVWIFSDGKVEYSSGITPYVPE